MTIARKRKRWWRWLIGLVVIVAILGFVGWYNLFRIVKPPPYESDLDHFLHASIGADVANKPRVDQFGRACEGRIKFGNKDFVTASEGDVPGSGSGRKRCLSDPSDIDVARIV